MKHIVTSFAFACALCMLSGCSSDSLSDEEWETPAPIKLNGSLSRTEESTRTIGPIIETKPTKDYAISLLRADETYTTSYLTTANPATLKNGGTISTNPQLYYQSDKTKKTKLVGVYPAVNGGTVKWSASTARTVTYTGLVGTTDVLCSTTIEGSKDDPMNGDGKSMVFNHMMTQVEVKAIWDANAVALWKNLSTVTLEKAYPNLVVTLPAPNASVAATSAKTGVNTTPLNFTSSSGGTPTAIAPSEKAETFGYLMFAPTTKAEGEALRFKVKMSDGVTVEPTTSPLGICEKGKKYVVTLQFTATGIEFKGVTIGEWTEVLNSGTIIIK